MENVFQLSVSSGEHIGIIRPCSVQETEKLEGDRLLYYQEPILIFVSNSNEKFNSGLTHKLFALAFCTSQGSDIFGLEVLFCIKKYQYKFLDFQAK